MTDHETRRRPVNASDVCRNGHERTPDNTYVRRGGKRPGSRDCRECRDRRAGTKRPGLRSLDYDPVAVDRAVAGDVDGHVLTLTERREAVRRLTDAGESIHGIAERLGCAPKTVQRIRRYLRQETP